MSINLEDLEAGDKVAITIVTTVREAPKYHPTHGAWYGLEIGDDSSLFAYALEIPVTAASTSVILLERGEK